MGGPYEERFGGSGRAGQNESEDGSSGDGRETGSVTKNGKKIDDLYRCQPHPGLQG